MPIYEYRCEKCGHIFDAFQRIGEGNENLNCPECETPRPSRLISAFASTGGSGGGFGGGSYSGCNTSFG